MRLYYLFSNLYIYKSIKFNILMNEDKIKEAFGKVKKDISEIKDKLDRLSSRTYANLREPNANLNEPITHKYANLREPTRTNEQIKLTPRTNKNFRDKLIKAIIFYIKQDYSTTEIKEIIREKFGVKRTCFFKYLKLSREYLNAIVIN